MHIVKGLHTAIVTGTSRGIGPYIARALVHEGFNLVLAARSTDELRRVANQLRSGQVQVIEVPTDVTKQEDLARLVAEANKAFGRVDVVVNNAGGDPQREFHNFTSEDTEYVIRLNLTSAI